LLFVVLASLGAGCGPSFQATYECDVRFEHCYALDETVASADVKRQCWHEWLSSYTFGQSRDRIEFATSRVQSFQNPPGSPDDDPPPAPTRAVAAPLPTNAFAPPPPVASAETMAVASSSAPAMARPPPARAPGAECAERCEQRWTACHETCRGATCPHCDRTYRACLPVCLRETTPGR
jgi:hypothetical protein